jgi:hypothetical protein
MKAAGSSETLIISKKVTHITSEEIAIALFLFYYYSHLMEVVVLPEIMEETQNSSRIQP